MDQVASQKRKRSRSPLAGYRKEAGRTDYVHSYIRIGRCVHTYVDRPRQFTMSLRRNCTKKLTGWKLNNYVTSYLLLTDRRDEHDTKIHAMGRFECCYWVGGRVGGYANSN